MSQLVRSLAGHLAPHHSPTRERREARFANPTPGDPLRGQKIEQEGGGQTSESKDNLVGKRLEGMQATVRSVTQATGGVEFLQPGIVEAIERSPQILDVALDAPGIDGENLEQIVAGNGIVLDRPPTDEHAPRWSKMSMGEKLLALRDAGVLSPEQRRSLTHQLLAARPHVTAHCVTVLDNRLRASENFVRAAERIMGLDEELFKLQEQIHAASQENNSQKLEQIEYQIWEHMNAAWGNSEYRRAIEHMFARCFQAYAGEKGGPLTEDEQTEIRRGIYQELRGSVHKLVWNMGNDGNQYTEKPWEYLRSLREQTPALKLLLDAQLQDAARETVQASYQRIERMLRELQIPFCSSFRELRAILIGGENTAGQLRHIDQQFLRRYKVSVLTVLLDFDKTTVESARAARIPLPAVLVDDHTRTPIPRPNEPGFLEHARGMLALWRERQQKIATGTDLVELEREQTNAEEWAHKTIITYRSLVRSGEWARGIRAALVAATGVPTERLPIVQRELEQSIRTLDPYETLSTPDARERVRVDVTRCITATGFPPGKRSNISVLLACVQQPNLLGKLQREKEQIDQLEREHAITGAADVVRISRETREKLHAVIGSLIPVRRNALPKDDLTDPINRPTERDLCKSLQHRISTYLHIGEKLIGLETGLKIELKRAEDLSAADPREALRIALGVDLETKRLEKCLALLSAFEQRTAWVDLPEGTLATYDRGSRTIKRNKKMKEQAEREPNPTRRKALQKELEDVFEHERGHAILHILTAESEVLPNLVGSTFDAYKDRRSDNEKTFGELLEELRDFGSYQHLDAQGLTGRERQEAFTEELLVRYADWKSGRERTYHRNELQLFDMLDQGFPAPQSAESTRELERIRQTGAIESYTVRDTDDDGSPIESAELYPMKSKLNTAERSLGNFKQFLAAYRADPRFPRNLFKELEGYYQGAEKWRLEIDTAFNQRTRNALGQLPEEDPALQKRCDVLERYAGELETSALGYDGKRLDITAEKIRDPGLLGNLLEGVRFASINDIVKFVNDCIEDFKDIHKRRQDRLLMDVGYAITKPLQDSNLLKKIPLPWINEYLPGLHGYHQRRYSNAEVEAADKWKDGMKKEDSHTLLHFLHHTDNKDAIRGIIALLCDRGEMDWNDTGVWATLNRISGYDMPEGPCLRSDVLRDTWLRKIISYVWNDKELYYHWRSENDSKTKSGKEHFTPWVDQLSNMRNGMHNELRKQLQLFSEWKIHGQHLGLTPPEDIKPHLYEKVIHYAISNGKMTMEDKFYYLVRGVAEGILSIDRLRTLAGEEGGVLNQFPFIDYFYGRNNTLPEVQALAKRLSERDEAGEDTFEPGINTTMWIQLDLVRDSKVQERLSKGTARTSSETIDHEDVPLFLPQLDYNSVRGMANVISGSRQKMSPEALKNLYCGYSSKFRVFGRLAQLDDDGVESFSGEDARILADAIGAYVDYDNLVTRKGYEAETRPQLTEGQLNSMAVSCDGKHTTMQYRRNMNRFVARLVQNIEEGDGMKISDTSFWQEFQKRHRKKEGELLYTPDGKPVIDADGKHKKSTTEPFRLLGDYVTKEADADRNAMQPNKKEVAAKLFDATEYFIRGLKEALKDNRNIGILKSTLKQFVSDRRTDEVGEDHFFNEGGSSAGNGITYARAKKAVQARAEQRQFQLTLGGGHH